MRSQLKRIQEKLKESAPKKSAWTEALGFFILGLGMFIAISLLSFDRREAMTTDPALIENLGGPLGNKIGYIMYSTMGIAALFWPLLLFFLGLLSVIGFTRLPSGSTMFCFTAITSLLASLAQIFPPKTLIFAQPYGPGGWLGDNIGMPIFNTLGYGGSSIFISFLTIASFVLAGLLQFSKTAEVLSYVTYKFQKAVGNVNNKRDAFMANNRKLSVISDSPKSEKLKKGNENEREAEALQNDRESAKTTIDLDLSASTHKSEKPSLSIFATTEEGKLDKEELEKTGERLTAELKVFKVEGKVTNVTEGPVVTTYEFEPAPGTKIAKIVTLREDLARLLKTASLRVIAPIPGKDTVGFEIPNKDKERRDIRFGSLVNDKTFFSKDFHLPIVMGVDPFGDPVIDDLANMPHLLVAGSTGSGKSVFINCLIASLLSRHSTKDLRLILVDPKMVELAAYNKCPHLACPVITEMKAQGLPILRQLVAEMEVRYEMIGSVGAKNILGFNEVIKSRRKTEFKKFEGKWQTLPFVVVIIDEFADMIMVLGKDAEDAITRLAQKARAAGIHLVLATQRPTVKVVTGSIKANFPSRVAFRVISGVDSRTILDDSGAEDLLGKGDMLFQTSKGIQRIHGAYISEKEIEKLIKALG
ncbi:MAG: DNA translocase FtsK 4TM domain-containing protein [Pseudomonadota bacterium]|nr:DNA translocase FtsK 4TM domain-containing protein [Pseudomonadota bacterium]